jgi:3-hydroxyacyl-CoA dehydrogenase
MKFQAITGATDLPEALREAVWVQGSVFEKLEITRERFKEINR